MGKKYIIELLGDCQSEFKGIMVFGLTQEKQISVELIPEESLRPYTEPDMEQVRKEAYEEGHKDGQSMTLVNEQKNAFTDGYKKCLKDMEQAEKIYESGKKAMYQKGLYDMWECIRKFANMSWENRKEVFGTTLFGEILKGTASEVFEKIRQYEHEKEMDGLRQNIQTIVDQCGYTLDEIAEVLRKMKEADNG